MSLRSLIENQIIQKRIKLPRKYITSPQPSSEDTNSNLITISLISDTITKSQKLSENNIEVESKKREYEYLHIDSLSRHIKTQYLQSRTVDEGFHCPYQDCSAFLGSAMHFLNHTARQHGLSL
ncbi:uncharacterized protein EAE97_000325 [Botrytis byssoidea]|uniref:Uncharacterized protein n=1 Tax=Botrytis byssoidea TaxID=139641 RepID=A0A9P5IV52_9HELO|nr:uncharacterized protein EAE97_000325 [Botrytis byssoidea]KAF7955066.1 hypothetical protein EAE97_000325 [Botrytis byssoidea]